MQSIELIAPHGGTLVDLFPRRGEMANWKEEAKTLPSITLDHFQLCDLEMLLNGGFSPLTGFMTREDYDTVVSDMRLANGVFWPIPITLAVDERTVEQIGTSQKVVLRDTTGLALAVMDVEDAWEPDKTRESKHVFGTTDPEHPGVAHLLASGNRYLGGQIHGLQLPPQYDFRSLRHTPREMRDIFTSRGWNRVVAFQTRNPMHRAHKELTDRAAEAIGGNVLIHPVVGMTKPGDIDYFTRVRCYQHLMKHYPKDAAMLSLLPLAMRMAGPREAVWHAIIRKNYGCTHFIVGRDHAGPGSDSAGNPFYGPYEAQDLLRSVEKELQIAMVPFVAMVYVPLLDAYVTIDEAKEQDETFINISGSELRRRLSTGEPIPEWYSYPEVVTELRNSVPPRHQQGLTVFFTGLSGSGKSTIANAVMHKIMEITGKPVTLLDGDVVRTNLSLGLDFTREGRSTNIRRIGFVAAEITRHAGTAVCAPIAPYEADRTSNRELISALGGYVEVYVDAPIEVCESRDVKGLYAKARAGIIKEFTGVSDPYEVPSTPDVVCRTNEETIEESANSVIAALLDLGYLQRPVDEKSEASVQKRSDASKPVASVV
ncbi:MAG: bifunctional sulfate adenylyltransferase/adenylylsulfate kinase [Rhodothermales bacterium]